ncbi:MAG: hypothetical protein KJO81_11825 [Gammaproteobacteria bacterium]|nr:hypothetical protein [Gammaproteobacteria bacterium]
MYNAQALEKIVASYIVKYRPYARKEDRHYERLNSLNEAISQAALCKDPRGKRHPHQYRIPLASLEEARQILLDLLLENCRNFEELHQTVEKAILHIHMVGPLTVYDISQRIGVYLGLKPNCVYLHSGTAEGARALGLTSVNGVLAVEALPLQFRSLSPDEIEDCLCIYKRELAAAFMKLKKHKKSL